MLIGRATFSMWIYARPIVHPRRGGEQIWRFLKCGCAPGYASEAIGIRCTQACIAIHGGRLMRKTFGAVLNGLLMLAAALGCVAQKANTPPPIAPVPGRLRAPENLHCEHGPITSRRLRLRNCKIRPGRPLPACGDEGLEPLRIVDSPADAELILRLASVRRSFRVRARCVWAGVQSGHRRRQKRTSVVDAGGPVDGARKAILRRTGRGHGLRWKTRRNQVLWWRSGRMRRGSLKRSSPIQSLARD